MPQLKVVVDQLNQRNSIPASLPDANSIVGVVNNGYTFQGTQVDAADVPNADLGTWYEDANGYYYWGGGLVVLDGGDIDGENQNDQPESTIVGDNTLDLTTAQQTGPSAGPDDEQIDDNGSEANGSIDDSNNFNSNPPPSAINYASMFSAIGADGDNIKVCVLDSGFYNHYAFAGQITAISDFTINNGSAIDNIGHGTHVAGIIKANFSNALLPVIGVAPNCELIAGKVIADNPGPNDVGFLVSGIDWAIAQNVKVLNLSLGIKDSDKPILQPAIQRAVNANIIIVAAAGDLAELDDGYVQYPAAEFGSCISVANVSPSYLSQNPSINPLINYLSGFVNYLSTTKPTDDFFESMSGSSVSTAFVTGIIIRILSQWKSQGEDISTIRRGQILEELDKMIVNKSQLTITDNSNFKISKP